MGQKFVWSEQFKSEWHSEGRPTTTTETAVTLTAGGIKAIYDVLVQVNARLGIMAEAERDRAQDRRRRIDERVTAWLATTFTPLLVNASTARVRRLERLRFRIHWKLVYDTKPPRVPSVDVQTWLNTSDGQYIEQVGAGLRQELTDAINEQAAIRGGR